MGKRAGEAGRDNSENGEKNYGGKNWKSIRNGSERHLREKVNSSPGPREGRNKGLGNSKREKRDHRGGEGRSQETWLKKTSKSVPRRFVGGHWPLSQKGKRRRRTFREDSPVRGGGSGRGSAMHSRGEEGSFIVSRSLRNADDADA